MTPGEPGTASIRTVARAPLANDPASHVKMRPLREQLPWLGVTVLTVTPSGSPTISVTPLAAAGPRLVTASEYAA
jgi:hypothetical protein